MCEYSGRLIAWLDRELPDEEATNVEWHVRQCAECRKAVSQYEEISGAFLACYEAVTVTKPRHKIAIWTMGSAAAAAAIVAAMLLAQAPVEKLVLHPPSPPPAPAIAVSAPVQVEHRAVRRPIRRQWIAQEPVVEVALPADALFPPGAVPPGFSFIADVRLNQ